MCLAVIHTWLFYFTLVWPKYHEHRHPQDEFKSWRITKRRHIDKYFEMHISLGGCPPPRSYATNKWHLFLCRSFRNIRTQFCLFWCLIAFGQKNQYQYILNLMYILSSIIHWVDDNHTKAQQELIRRWDSERELSLRRHRTCKGQRLPPLNRLPNFCYNWASIR